MKNEEMIKNIEDIFGRDHAWYYNISSYAKSKYCKSVYRNILITGIELWNSYIFEKLEEVENEKRKLKQIKQALDELDGEKNE